MVLRTRKDGLGMSLCSAEEDKVGMGRCIHIAEGASVKVNGSIVKGSAPIEVETMQRGMRLVDYTNEADSRTRKENKRICERFLGSLKSIDVATRMKIIAEL